MTSILPDSILSEESFGTPLVTRSGERGQVPTVYVEGNPVSFKEITEYYYTEYQYITPISIDESEVGSPTITTGPVSVYPVSIISAESVGTPRVMPEIRPESIASQELVSTDNAILAGPVTISPISIESGESFESPVVQRYLYPASIESASVVSEPQLNLKLYAQSISSQEQVSTGAVITLFASPISIESEETFGIPTLSLFVQPESIESESVVSEPQLNLTLYPESVASGELVSTDAHVYLTISPEPVIDSSEVPAPSVRYVIRPDSILSKESVGIPKFSQFVVLATSVESEESFGTPTIQQTFIWSDIKRFDPDLWQSLFDKEQYCYASSSGSLRDKYEPLFKELGDDMLAYFGADWTDDIRDFITSLYSYIVFSNYYATDSSLLTSSSSSDIFTIDGYINDIKAKAVDYYADYDVGTSTAPHLSADISTVSGGYTVDNATMKALMTGYQEVVSKKTHDLLFDDFPVLATLDKHQMGDKIFNDLDYARIYRSFGVDLNIPSYIM